MIAFLNCHICYCMIWRYCCAWHMVICVEYATDVYKFLIYVTRIIISRIQTRY